MIGDTNFEPQPSAPYPPPQKNSVLFTSRLVLQKIALDCYVNILNFITKSYVKYCFLSSSLSPGVMSLIWPSVWHSLKYLQSDVKRWQIPVLCFVFSLISGLQNGCGAYFRGLL